MFLPPHLLARTDLDADSAEKMLRANDQFDQVQLMVNEAAQVYKSSWVWGEKVQGGTLEVRMDAERSKIVILGEGVVVDVNDVVDYSFVIVCLLLL